MVAIFCNRLLTDSPITIYGDGSQTRDYVYVGDVARANLAATRWTIPALGTIDDVAFNVGTASETSVNQLAAALLETTGRTVPIQHAPARAGELQRSSVGVERASSELAWTPEMPLAEGLNATFEWIAGEVG